MCCDNCCDDDCKCFWSEMRKSNGKAVIGAAVLIILFMIFVVLFYAVRACGKKISRILSIIILFLINVALAVLSLYIGFDKFCILLASLSSFAALCDLIMFILISCLEGFKNQASDNQDYYRPSPQTQQLQEIQPNTPTNC